MVVHIGYSTSIDDKYEKLLNGDIVIETQDSKKKFTSRDYVTFWNALKKKNGFGEIDESLPQEHNSGCAVCGEYLIQAPGRDVECVVDGCCVTKHGTITNIRDNEDQVREDMIEYFGPQGPGPGKRNDPIELAVRAGLQCPNGHWVCSDCLTFNRDEIPTESPN